jgi:hypothetical protein
MLTPDDYDLGDYDLTVGVSPRLLRIIGAKRNICLSGPSAGRRIRGSLSMLLRAIQRF